MTYQLIRPKPVIPRAAPKLRYILIRTRRALIYSGDALDAFLDHIPRPVFNVLRMGGSDTPDWADGLALQFTGTTRVDDLARHMKAGLDPFESWLIHDGDAAGAWPHSTWSADAVVKPPFAQVFLTFHDGERDPDGVAEMVRGALKCEAGPAFHLRNGRVLFAYTDQPARTLLRRCERIASRLRHLAACDRQGDIAQLPLAAGLDPWRSHTTEYSLVDDPPEELESVFGRTEAL